MRMLLLVATALVALGPTPDASGSAPLILGHPTYRAGHLVGLQVAAPDDAKTCRLAIAKGHQVVARRRVSLGGPTRIIRWRVGRSAVGSWVAQFTCSGGNWTASRRTTVIVKKPGRPRGRIVTSGSMLVLHGPIPEMPREKIQLSHFANPLSNDDVVINRCSNGVVGCFNPCSQSEQINSTRTTGDGAGTAVQAEPSGTARANAVANLASEKDLFRSSLDENYALYREMWSDLQRCANLPSNLSGHQRHSLYEQMACHALYGVSSKFGGNTWDFEAWRNDVDWTKALSIDGHCGQDYGDVGLPNDYLQGVLVKAFDTHASTLMPEAWLLSNRRRRNVATTRGYGCLTANGRGAATWYPSSFLDQYFAARDRDVSDEEACGPGVAAPPGPPAAGSVPPPPTGPSSTQGFHIQDTFYGGTWARTDPNDGTWYAHANRPANGAYWYPNGLGVGVDCARAAAGYVVKFGDGHSENWNTWFHVTDGKWFPSAAAQETTVNGFYGLAGC